jgi:hypothetical protein
VAHTCNPSYSGGRDQEDRGSKPAQINSSRDPISKKPFKQKGWLSDSSTGKHETLSSNPSDAKNKKKEKRNFKQERRTRVEKRLIK